ncbi:tetratricopeptide repeat protein [Nonomuraea sp. NPDC052129]|uniref:tetratricopeptide repeat protein n=1 Tax=Nonomuraea sp. NPDC052129 TaxID=3154651 RepID=UPI0034331659
MACRMTLARQVGAMGRTEEALALAEELVEVGTRVHGADSGIVFGGRFEIAVWTRWGGNPRRAVELWQELAADKVAIGDGEIADTLDNIEAALEEIGDPRRDADAVAWLDGLVERAFQEEALNGWGAMTLFTNLAWWVGGRMDGAGDHERAREIAEWALEVGRSVFGAGDAHVLAGEVILAHQLGRLGDPEAAVRRCARVAEDAARIYGETHLLTGFARSVLRRWSPQGSAG